MRRRQTGGDLTCHRTAAPKAIGAVRNNRPACHCAAPPQEKNKPSIKPGRISPGVVTLGTLVSEARGPAAAQGRRSCGSALRPEASAPEGKLDVFVGVSVGVLHPAAAPSAGPGSVLSPRCIAGRPGKFEPCPRVLQPSKFNATLQTQHRQLGRNLPSRERNAGRSTAFGMGPQDD
ncbi:uncharacterized protein LOC143521775 isoform X2 [Brachyhypopomus gauderio]|uniref:uncharacterized protein LOC143521775 isoform X2 n=1 Tax=Brachyhypopomus gauderio TaxID=698409 RepID=UPI0040434323